MQVDVTVTRADGLWCIRVTPTRSVLARVRDLGEVDDAVCRALAHKLRVDPLVAHVTITAFMATERH
jgi:hypothetical protein